MKTPELPENAPFDSAQRAWLNGYIAAVLTGAEDTASGDSETEAEPAVEASAPEEPWHDPALSLAERMKLAEGRGLEDRLMAATANEDCGTCGFDCRGYARALASGSETDTTLCGPGGNETRKQLKAILAEEG